MPKQTLKESLKQMRVLDRPQQKSVVINSNSDSRHSSLERSSLYLNSIEKKKAKMRSNNMLFIQ